MDKLTISELIKLINDNDLDPDTEIYCESIVGGNQDSFWANMVKVEEYDGAKIINIGGGI